MLQFLVQSEGRPDLTVSVEENAFEAGADPSLPLRIEDSAAAARHFRVEVRDVGVVLKDLATESGTKVNGNLVSQVRLAAGDMIEVGSTRIVFLLQGAGAAPAPVPVVEVEEIEPAPIARPPSTPVAAAPKAVPRDPESTRQTAYSRRRRSGAVIPVVTVLLLLAGAVAGYVHLLGGGDEESTPVASLPPDEPRPPVDPAPGFEPPEFVMPERLKPKSPGMPAPEVPELPPGPTPEPPPEPPPEPDPAVPDPDPEPATPDVRPPAPDPSGEALRERERLDAAGREKLRRFDEMLSDRIARYTFDGPILDLEELLTSLPAGRLKQEVLGRHEDLVRAQSTFDRVRGALSGAKGRKITLASGLDLYVTGADEEGFDAKVGPATTRKKWTELDPETIHEFLADGRPDVDGWLDLSAFAALFGLREEAEFDLFRAFKKDKDRLGDINAAIARRRGMELPPGGFVLNDGEWVTVEEKGYLDKGLVKHEGRWLTKDEVMAARGYVKHEGRWLSPDDYAEVLAAQKREEELAKKYMPKGLIDKPGHGDSTPWTSVGKAPVVLKTRNYKIQTNLSREVANDIAYTMETLNTNLKVIFGLRKVSKFTVNVCATRDEFRGLWRAAGGSLGFCSGSEICTFYQPPMTTSVLMHEGTHQILRKFASTCPRWMHEAMASFFECSKFEFDPKKKRVGLKVGLLNSMRLQGFQMEMRTGRDVSLETFMRGQGGNPYTQGWALVYYLAKGKDGKYAKRLHKFVQEAGKGNAVKHFQKIFRVRDLQAWEKDWKEWIKGLNPADGVSLAGNLR